MTKRSRLEVLRDILKIISENRGLINLTPLLRKSNLSSQRFYEYLEDMKSKGFIIGRSDGRSGKKISITEKGNRYLEKYSSIMAFIEEFDL